MRVSAREAARMLADAGLTRPQTRRLLEAGLAGAAERAGGALLYDAARIETLRDAPEVVLPAGTGPMLVARVGPARGLRLDRSVEERRAAVAGPWPATALQRVEMRRSVQVVTDDRSASVPFLATVSGYVAFAAELVGVAVARSTSGAGEETYFDLGDPGPWARDAVGTRCPTGPGDSWLWFS